MNMHSEHGKLIRVDVDWSAGLQLLAKASVYTAMASVHDVANNSVLSKVVGHFAGYGGWRR